MVNIEKHLLEIETCKKDHLKRDNSFTVAVLEQAYEVAKELQKHQTDKEEGLLHGTQIANKRVNNMTEIEAKNFLKAISCTMKEGVCIEQRKEALFMGMQALEKQIPKKPDLEGDGYDNDGNLVYDTWICPNCEKHYEVDYDNYDYCPNCGQKLKWGNEDAE